jgi:hypothetical protein
MFVAAGSGARGVCIVPVPDMRAREIGKNIRDGKDRPGSLVQKNFQLTPGL